MNESLIFKASGAASQRGQTQIPCVPDTQTCSEEKLFRLIKSASPGARPERAGRGDGPLSNPSWPGPGHSHSQHGAVSAEMLIKTFLISEIILLFWGWLCQRLCLFSRLLKLAGISRIFIGGVGAGGVTYSETREHIINIARGFRNGYLLTCDLSRCWV